MQAALLLNPGKALELTDVALPVPAPGQVLLRNRSCGVCRTDLHIADGEINAPDMPLILGHQIVGEVVDVGSGVASNKIGQRVGVPRLGYTCGQCDYCRSDKENLCDQAQFTGLDLNGGFAQYSVADTRFCFSIDPQIDDLQVAPLLCGGLIGYRAYRMIKDARVVGFYGFGSAAHLLLQLANFQNKVVYAFTRAGDTRSQAFAKSLGAHWAGASGDQPPQMLDAAIIFAPVGELVPLALKAVRKGGVVVCAGIHMSDIPSMPYETLWGERTVCSVANLTRQDGVEFLKLAAKVRIQSNVRSYRLEQVNEAMDDLRAGRIDGSAVIKCS